MMPTLHSPETVIDNSGPIRIIVESPKLTETLDINNTKSNVSQDSNEGSTTMTFANGTMTVPNFIITNVKSLTSASKVSQSVSKVPETDSKNNIQNILPISNLQNIQNSLPVACAPNIPPSIRVTRMQNKCINLEKNVESSFQESPEWLKSPIKKYVVKRMLPANISTSKIQVVNQEHAYVSKHQSPVITMKKIIPPQGSVKSFKSFKHTCRLCLRFRENLIPLFCGEQTKPELIFFLKECCSVEVSPDDPLPKYVCYECKLKLIAAWSFRKQCQRTDNELRECHKLPRKNYFVPRVDTFITKSDKGIQVECYSLLNRKAEHLIKQEENEEQTTFNDNVQEVSNLASNEENDDKNGNTVTYFLESFAQEISNDVSNLDDQLTKLLDVRDFNKLGSRKVEINEEMMIRKKRQRKKRSLVEKGNFLCHMCPRVFTTKGFLERHANIHLAEKIFTCITCSKVFKTEEKLKIHMKVHDKIKRFECEVCGLKYAYEYLLNSHLRLHGRGRPLNTEKHFLCEVCSKTFASQSGLKHHQQLHLNLKPHKCKFCEKTFTMPIYRKKHELRHSANRQFKCHLCPAVYASTNGLTNHLLLHTGEAHYHCKTCGKSFRRRKYLNEHIFTHTGEKPYICKMCGTGYGNSGSLFAHQKRCRIQFNDETENPVLENVENETLVQEFLVVENQI